MNDRRGPWCAALALLVAGLTGFCECPSGDAGASGCKAPKGFSALFNGQDLSGWRGGDTFDHRKVLAMPADQREAQIAKWTATMTQMNAKTGKPHWYVEKGGRCGCCSGGGGSIDKTTKGAGAEALIAKNRSCGGSPELVNDGQGAYATTEKDYGDFELLLEYKTVPLADSGIYLRGCPQVQIWDYTEKAKFSLGAGKGSGGLWNNSPGTPGKDPLVLADKPFGEWNKVRVLMVGARVSVWLNGKLVVNHALLENYYDRKTPVPLKGPIQLQTHGGEIRWRNLFIREIGTDEANKILASHGNEGFKPVFNGKNFEGWAGPTKEYEVVNGAMQCRPKKGGTIYTTGEYDNFKARLEFKLPPGGNNGLAIRYPGHGNTAYDGMCELQVLDDNYEKATGEKIDPRQAHGSAYGMVAAARGYQRPIGEWNFEEVTVDGPEIKVELNGTMILDCDLSTVTEYMASSKHPGKDRTKGSFGFAGHNDPVAFRNIEIKPL